MTERSFVWEVGGGGDESPHSVADWGAVEAAIAGVASANEGVLPRMLNELAPSTQAGATQIRIASGWAIVDGHPYHNDGNEDFTPVTPAVGTTGRRAVLRADWSAQTVRIVEISSADGTATIPTLTQTSGTTYEIPLCQYTVTTGGAIGAFVDEREFAGGFAALGPVINYKTATQTFATTTTLANVSGVVDDTFTFPVVAEGVYEARYWIPLAISGTGGVKFQLAGPASPTSVVITGYRTLYRAIGSNPAQVPFNPVTAFGSNVAAGNSAAGSGSQYPGSTEPLVIEIRALIVNGANAGEVTLQAAQNQSDGTTTIGTGAFMEARRVA